MGKREREGRYKSKGGGEGGKREGRQRRRIGKDLLEFIDFRVFLLVIGLDGLCTFLIGD